MGDTDSSELCLKSFRQVTGLLNLASQSGLMERQTRDPQSQCAS